MRVVSIDSPGHGPEPHWSAAAAEELAGRLRERGDEVIRLSGDPGTRGELGEVSRFGSDMPLEIELVRFLRSRYIDAVVHFGVGAGGSPNPLWLAARMGAPAFAALRVAELVCHRGDLITANGEACGDFLDPERCASCCRSGRRIPRPDDFRNRIDLLVAGLQGCAAVFATDSCPDDDRLFGVGVPRAIQRPVSPDRLVRSVLDAL